MLFMCNSVISVCICTSVSHVNILLSYIYYSIIYMYRFSFHYFHRWHMRFAHVLYRSSVQKCTGEEKKRERERVRASLTRWRCNEQKKNYWHGNSSFSPHCHFAHFHSFMMQYFILRFSFIEF